MERWHHEASLVHISSTRGAPEGHRVLSMLWPDNDGATRRREPSPVCSHDDKNHNAHPAQGARRLGLDLAGKELPHYDDSDPDNHGQHPRI